MSDPAVDALVLDLLQWLALRDRSYEEVMDAWRTSCPKLPVWEEANDLGLVERADANGRSVVRISASGRALLQRSRPAQRDGAGVTSRSI
jgi:D-3-phosphoglycerate dehydrogenase